MSQLDRITVEEGKCIRGLRIRVKDILEMLAAGMSRKEILQDFPYLEAEDITAALEYAASQNSHFSSLENGGTNAYH
jgi:uncharacterized protein (DUF433 family)